MKASDKCTKKKKRVTSVKTTCITTLPGLFYVYCAVVILVQYNIIQLYISFPPQNVH